MQQVNDEGRDPPRGRGEGRSRGPHRVGLVVEPDPDRDGRVDRRQRQVDDDRHAPARPLTVAVPLGGDRAGQRTGVHDRHQERRRRARRRRPDATGRSRHGPQGTGPHRLRDAPLVLRRASSCSGSTSTTSTPWFATTITKISCRSGSSPAPTSSGHRRPAGQVAVARSDRTLMNPAEPRGERLLPTGTARRRVAPRGRAGRPRRSAVRGSLPQPLVGCRRRAPGRRRSRTGLRAVGSPTTRPTRTSRPDSGTGRPAPISASPSGPSSSARRDRTRPRSTPPSPRCSSRPTAAGRQPSSPLRAICRARSRRRVWAFAIPGAAGGRRWPRRSARRATTTWWPSSWPVTAWHSTRCSTWPPRRGTNPIPRCSRGTTISSTPTGRASIRASTRRGHRMPSSAATCTAARSPPGPGCCAGGADRLAPRGGGRRHRPVHGRPRHRPRWPRGPMPAGGTSCCACPSTRHGCAASPRARPPRAPPVVPGRLAVEVAQSHLDRTTPGAAAIRDGRSVRVLWPDAATPAQRLDHHPDPPQRGAARALPGVGGPRTGTRSSMSSSSTTASAAPSNEAWYDDQRSTLGLDLSVLWWDCVVQLLGRQQRRGPPGRGRRARVPQRRHRGSEPRLARRAGRLGATPGRGCRRRQPARHGRQHPARRCRRRPRRLRRSRLRGHGARTP